MYETTDVFDLRNVQTNPFGPQVVTLVTFTDGYQWCSHCGLEPVDHFTAEELAEE